jgi:hypothetical protein
MKPMIMAATAAAKTASQFKLCKCIDDLLLISLMMVRKR